MQDAREMVKLKTAVFRKQTELNSELCQLEPDYERAAGLADDLAAACLLVVRRQSEESTTDGHG